MYLLIHVSKKLEQKGQGPIHCYSTAECITVSCASRVSRLACTGLVEVHISSYTHGIPTFTAESNR